MAVTWNANYELTPLPQDSPTGIDDEVRVFKNALSKRMANEHETFETDNSSGAEGEDFVHKAGSTKAYYQEEEPELRPDGVTTLDAEDAGRIWIKASNKIKSVWDGTEWVSDETLQGEITFTEFPIFPETSPTTDYQAVHKAYVDDTFTTTYQSISLTESENETANIAAMKVGETKHVRVSLSAAVTVRTKTIKTPVEVEGETAKYSYMKVFYYFASVDGGEGEPSYDYYKTDDGIQLLGTYGASTLVIPTRATNVSANTTIFTINNVNTSQKAGGYVVITRTS